jgi:hypothetical protein
LPKNKEKTMANRKFWLGMLVMALAFGMTVVGCDDGSTDEGNYQGTYNVYGYYHHLDKKLMGWSSLTDPAYASLKAGCPTKIVLSSNSASITGGMYNGQTLSARTSGSTLYATINNTEIVMGTFSSGDFRMTYGLDFASEGAYVVYKK